MRRLQDLVARQAASRPEATAIVADGDSMTYGDLDDLSSRLAAVLLDHGVTRGSRVCMLLPKTAWALVSILGILKAGGIYVPLDPDSPASRIAKMLRSCDDRWLLASPARGDMVAELLASPPSSGSWVVGWMEEGSPAELGPAACFTTRDVLSARPRSGGESGGPGDDAYIMFTSGSTGVPKGVRITHQNVLSFLDWAVPYFGLGQDDRISAHPPLHFDLSVFDIFGSAAAGSQLHLVPPRLNLLAASLARFIRDSSLTQWFSVPSLLNHMMKADCVRPGDFPTLRRLLWCGEVLPTPTLAYFMQRLPHARFTNLYGPTEATIASSYYTVPEVPTDLRQSVPIGTSCAGEELFVLDESRRATPPGEVGDLFISGAGLSPGYWLDPAKTDAAFVEILAGPEPRRAYRTGDLARVDSAGLLHYVGRADTQIKSRGYRIELGEIEAALHSLACLGGSAVVAIPSDSFEGWTICCAFVAAPGSGVDPSAVADSLRKALPRYMIPQRWLEYASLPTNANGKIDRPQLRADFEALSESPA